MVFFQYSIVHLIGLCHFFLNQSFDGMGSTNTHDTRRSAESVRLASCIQIMDSFAVRVMIWRTLWVPLHPKCSSQLFQHDFNTEQSSAGPVPRNNSTTKGFGRGQIYRRRLGSAIIVNYFLSQRQSFHRLSLITCSSNCQRSPPISYPRDIKILPTNSQLRFPL